MFGVTGPVLNWLRSYLTDRTQLVKQGDDLFAPMLLQTGIPQGSVLGPILFTSIISPVHCIATQFGVHQQQYADDTQLYMEFSSDPSDPGLTNLESALLSLSSWFLHNGLALNPEKSDALAHMHETALYPNLRSMLLVPLSLSQPPSNCLVSISTIT